MSVLMSEVRPNVLFIMTDEERYPPPYEDATLAEYRARAADARAAAGRRAGAAPPLRRVDGMPAEPGHAVHRAVPVAARGDQHRWHGQGGVGPDDEVARPRHGSDHGRLVPGRRLPHPLPRQVAHLPRRPPHPGHARRAASQPPGRLRCRRGRRRVPAGRSPRSLWLQWVDRRRAARRRPGRHRHRPRPDLRRAGGGAIRGAGRRSGRGSVDNRGLVGQPARHSVLGLRLGGARGSLRRRTPCRTSPPRPARPTRSTTARPPRGCSGTPGPACSTSSRSTSRTVASTTGSTSWSTRRSGASSTRSRRRARPRTPSSCSPRTTATSWARTAGCSRSGTTGYDEALRVPFVVAGPGASTARTGGARRAHEPRRPPPPCSGWSASDVEELAAGVAEHHVETQPLVGRDLSGLLDGIDRGGRGRRAPSTS